MIVNGTSLSEQQKHIVARSIVRMSTLPGSSLLPRSEADIINALHTGDLFVKVHNDTPIFTVAFEPTGNARYVEIGMTCNFYQGTFSGKKIFPEIVAHYRNSVCGNGEQIVYLTTNDLRMFKIAHYGGFHPVEDPRKSFPADVLSFCCSPCSVAKTGVAQPGDQLTHCPRFFGEFLPKKSTAITHMRCTIMFKRL